MKYFLKALYNRVFRRKQVDAIVKELKYKDGQFQAAMEHPGFAIFAREIGQMLRDYQAPNFLETKMFDYATMKTYTITIQDCTRPTPLEVIHTLRTALESIAKPQQIYSLPLIDLLRQTATQALRDVGYHE